MWTVIDSALPESVFTELATEKAKAIDLDPCLGAYSVHRSEEFRQSEAAQCIYSHVEKLVGPVTWIGAYFVLTSKGDMGSNPHYDMGPTAILHLAKEWAPEYGGQFVVLKSDEETIEELVEYKPNRLVVCSEDVCHRHLAPVVDQRRITLVSRFKLRD